MGSIRYGSRVGSISPPPPGLGPCYRSQCCWPNALGDIHNISWTSTLAHTSINNYDIASYANKLKIEKATSDLSRQASVRDQFQFSNKFLLKGKLRRCGQVRRHVFEGLCSYEDEDILNNLDRIPRFRFGGNRSNHKVRDSEKSVNEQLLKDVNDRLRRSPVVPPRTKRNAHSLKQPSKINEPTTTTTPIRPLPLRSASFSQVEYLPDGKKYIRRPDDSSSTEVDNIHQRGIATLPRSKNSSQCDEIAKQRKNSMFDFQQNTITKDEQTPDINENTPKLSDYKELSAGISRLSSVDSIEDKKFKSKRRKGVYLSQWSVEPSDNIIPQFVEDGDFSSLARQTNNNSDTQRNSNMDSKLNDLSQWSSPQEEPLSPEDNNTPPEWPNRYRIHPTYLFERTNSVESHSRETSLQRLDSFSEDEPDSERKSDQLSLLQSDLSDLDGKVAPKRYTKRPLRGPYGQMLEAEMKKPEVGIKNNCDLNFLNEMSTNHSATRSSSMKLENEFKPKHSKRDSSSKSYDENHLKECCNKKSDQQRTGQPKRKVSADNFILDRDQLVNHQRTISSPSKFENLSNPVVSNKLLTQLLQGSSEQLAILATKEKLLNDTRTHVVVELYDNEKNYVESLQILTTKYLEPLKSPEYATLLDSALVDEIFNQIPFLLTYHQQFLEELKKRLEQWDIRQKVGDVLVEFFSKPALIDSYTSYVNNWKRARNIIKTTQQTKAPFAKFLETTAREHRGKLALDSLLIKPIQRFPRYELLLQRLIKHTDVSHADHSLLLVAQKELHEQTQKINCTERETLELDLLREIEGLIDGLIDLVSMDRQFIRHELVSMTGAVGTRRERGLLLFSDLLLITSIKRKSGAIKKPLVPSDKSGVVAALEANKYKLLMKIPLEDLEIAKSKDENVRQMMIEIDNLNEDRSILNQIGEMCANLHCNHNQLDEIVKEMISSVNKHLNEQQNCESQLSSLDLNLTTPGEEHISIMFSTPEKRSTWEEAFIETKNKLVISGVKKPLPELVATVPIRKTRAGLQFTCAASTLGDSHKSVWVCNSDGYVGQVCILSFQPEPTVLSCNSVCNARILCIASVPAGSEPVPPTADHEIQLDSSSSSEEDDKSDHEDFQEPHHQVTNSTDNSSVDLDEVDHLGATMWIGTEDGYIHVYSSTDNIRIKRNKTKIRHNSSILSIIYMDGRVFVSLANGDVVVYEREGGVWNVNSPITIQVGSISSPVLKLIANDGKLWCNYGNFIKILNPRSLVTENTFSITTENNKPISCIVVSGNNVWLSIQHSATIKCYNSSNFEFVCEVNVAAAVTKMLTIVLLTGCDDIIRQHKAACLRVTSLLACKDLIWIGTSAGVLLTMPHIQGVSNVTSNSSPPVVTGVSHGHTGQARFLTYLEIPPNIPEIPHRHMFKRISDQRNNFRNLVISGGDGYEDFRCSNISEVAGREDSTNHLLLWSV
ncbi:rho guanine nucleotide exchange factor 17 isoform X2 [Harmonia axyridis]|uniref:rho guanine nucleotide exchange factor 17 isoform X2 n=1 Tax=Harmonia axyridis TaxID=115357 RepID=UPI001E2779CF|nr:rho guanine nucleotide exchange factor 17 isoform X2 [Harmonia axyridis]